MHTFTQSEFYNVSFDIHTIMRATLFLTDAPDVTEVPDAGTFIFRDVVPGSYRVTGFHDGKAISMTLQVSGTGTTLKVP